MPFPKKFLLDSETVALDLRPHWWFFAGPLFSGIPVLALAILAYRQEGDWRTALWYLTLAAALAWAVWLGARLITWQTTHFVVTSQRLVFRSGILSKHSRDIPLDKVEYVEADQTIFERLIGAGDLLIKSGDEQEQAFSDIPKPETVKKEIHHQKMEADKAGAMNDGPPRQVSIPDQIAALADLLDRGAISPAEYEAKKAQLLDRL